MSKYSTSLRDVWRIVKKRRFIFLLGPLILGVAGALFSILNAPPPLYSAVCKIQFDRELLSEGLPSFSGVDPVDAQLPGIRSYAVIRKAAEKMGLMTFEDPSDARLVSRLEALRSKVSVQREPSSDHADIKVTDPNPDVSRKLANTIALIFLEYHAGNRTRHIAASIEGIDAQLQEVQQKLGESRKAFETFSRDNQLLSIELQSETLLKEGRDTREQLRRLAEDERELGRVLSRLRRFIKKPSGPYQSFYTSKATDQYLSLNSALGNLTSKQDSTGQSPGIMRTAKKMAGLLSRRISDLRESMSVLEEDVRKSDQKTEALLEQKLKIEQLKKRIKADEEMVGLLERRKRELLIKSSNRSGAVTVVRPALLPKTPVNPPGTFRAALYGILIGLFLALAGAFILEAFESSSGAIEDVERGLGLRVLGVVPKMGSEGERVPEKGKPEAGSKTGQGRLMEILAAHYFPDSAIAENFRLIRTRILSQGEANSTKTVVVTSASLEEGKTLVAVNLAVTAAQSGMKTLLVETDLRRPVLAGIFQIETSPGFVEVLVGDTPWETAVKTVTHLMMGKMTPDEIMKTPGLDNLHIITSGDVPSNPAPLLESDRLVDFIKEIESSYDLVIFDAPHVLAWNDATILATKVPAALLVYRVGEVSKRLLRRAVAQLEQVGCRLLGVILNGIRPEIRPVRSLQAYDGFPSVSDKRRGPSVFDVGNSDTRSVGGGSIGAAQGVSQGEGTLDQEKMEGKPFTPRLIHILVALLFLGVGLLWHSGLIDPLWQSDSGKKAAVLEKYKMPEDPPSETRVVKPVERIRKTPLPDETQPEVVKPERTPSEVTTVVPQTVPPPVEPEKAEEALVEEKSVFSPYALYLGSFRTMKRVKRAVSLYREQGLSVYWVRVYFKEKGLWYRLYAGHFENAADARQFMRQHALDEAEIKHTRYANLIDDSSVPDDLGDRIETLESKGYAPYVIGTPGGHDRLYVGAYLTRQGAERQNRDLEADGIAGQVVER